MHGTIIIFVKAPRAGAVKTRLGADIGMGRAAALFRHLTEQTILEARRSTIPVQLAIDPPSQLYAFKNLWPTSLPRFAQVSGSLGDRMAHALRRAPPGPVIVIGADAPAIRARHLRQAMARLGGADVVFGPAKDGGFWLIGLARRRAAPSLFSNVRWSSRHALKDTKASLPKGFVVEHLPTLSDVDDANDLKEWAPRSCA